MRITVSNVLTVDKPTPELEAWCKKQLTIANPDYAKKSRMHLYIGNTPRTLTLYERNGDKLVLPFGALRLLPKSITDSASFESEFKTPVSVDYGGNDITLYDYQRIAVDEVLRAQYGILQSPAGSGKTQIGIALVKRYGRRALWLTHTKDLLNQSKERALQFIDKSTIGTITEGKVDIGSGITFATVQTMCRLDLAQYKNYWDLIIVDECHRCSGTPTAVTQFSKVLNSLAARHKIGLSATVHRSDGMIQATYALLGNVVYTVPDEAVGDKIMKVGILPVGTGFQITRGCLNTDGTLNYAKLINALCTDKPRLQVIVDSIVSESEHSCLILSDRLEHLSEMMRMLPDDMQSESVMVSGKMTSKTGKAQREQAIEEMRTGKRKYLFATYTLCKEGLDIPRLERLFLTTPQKDYAVITQSIGRIARTFDGKTKPIAYDFIDDVGFLIKSYRKRCSTYKKNGCYFVAEKGDLK